MYSLPLLDKYPCIVFGLYFSVGLVFSIAFDVATFAVQLPEAPDSFLRWGVIRCFIILNAILNKFLTNIPVFLRRVVDTWIYMVDHAVGNSCTLLLLSETAIKNNENSKRQ